MPMRREMIIKGVTVNNLGPGRGGGVWRENIMGCMLKKGKAMSYKNPGICLYPFQILIYDSSSINCVCCR